MAIRIVSFGQLADLTGKEFQASVADTDQLAILLRDQYNIRNDVKYMLAVNKKIINQNTVLTEADSVALLPPYSGG